MIKVSHMRYEEVFRGETTVRNEPPHLTNNWLNRRIELAQRDIRSAEARLADARRHNASIREHERLVYEDADARERYAHASEAKRRFAEVWKQGHGYVDEALWESRVKAREEAERRRARETAELPVPGDDESSKGKGSTAEPKAGVNCGPVKAGEEDPAEHPAVGEPASKTFPVRTNGDADEHVTSSGEVDSELKDSPQSVAEDRVPERRSYKGFRNTPPDEFKFKKGAPSPNKAGRPKGARNLRTVIRELANQTIRVTHKGRRKTVNVIGAAMQLQVQKALSGDTKAFALVLPLLREFWNEEVEPKDTELSADERALLKNLVRARKLLSGDDKSGGGPA